MKIMLVFIYNLPAEMGGHGNMGTRCNVHLKGEGADEDAGQVDSISLEKGPIQ
jgi:hypothetical protein